MTIVSRTTVYTSYDYGDTWTKRQADRWWNGVAMSSDGRIQTAVSSYDYIYVSYDYGVTWNPKGNILGVVDNVEMSSDGTIQVVVGRSGTPIYVSTDSGNTWTATTQSGFENIAMSSDGTIMAATYLNSPITLSYF
jgi:photosystem II stability/assembly factor-like uncharacterized protein